MASNKTISIIEDDITMRNLLQTLLQLEGFIVNVLPPTNVPEMLIKLHQEKPDAVLLDVHLKNINGIDIVKQITKHKTVFRPLIIMASGMDLEMECMKAGADFFLLKPYMPDRLISWLHEHLDQSVK